MDYEILIEGPAGEFHPEAGTATFTGTADEAQAHITALQAADGVCRAAQAVQAAT